MGGEITKNGALVAWVQSLARAAVAQEGKVN